MDQAPEEGAPTPGGAAALPPEATTVVLKEVLGLYLGTLLAIKAVVWLQSALKLPADVLVLVPLLFLYVPIFWLRHRKLDPDDFGMAVHLRMFGPALRIVALLSLAIWPAFLVGNHVYQQWVRHAYPGGVFPASFLSEVLLYHLLFVGPPEEFFYRGYMQSRLNQVFPRRLRVLGVPVGWGLVLTALLFTVGHSIVVVRWWHFSIFFPALLFGWIREKTGNVVASSLFHALCNIIMVTLDTWYGVIPPCAPWPGCLAG